MMFPGWLREGRAHLRHAAIALPWWRLWARRRALRSPPRVAVVIPARNAERTLGATLDSLLAQSFPAWEAVVIDNGSTDSTSAVLAGYCARDARIRALTTAPGGVSRARNDGLAATGAPLVMFLDADDWIAPDYFEHMLAALEADPAAAASFCGSIRVLPGGSALPEMAHAAMTYSRELEADPVALLSWTCPLAIHSVIVRRSYVDTAGGFDADLVSSEDWDLWMRVARVGGKFIGVPRVLAFYRLQDLPAGAPSRDPVRTVRDAQRVMARARRPDGRLGTMICRTANPHDERHAAAEITLYFAAVTAASGGDATPVLATLVRWPDLSGDAALDTAVADIEAGLVVGCRATHAGLASRWDSVASHLAPLAAAIEQAGSRPGAGRRFLEKLECYVLGSDSLESPRALSLTHGFRVDLDAPHALMPAVRVERTWLRVCAKGRVLDEFAFPNSLSLTPGDIARRVLVQWGLRDWLAIDGRAATVRACLRVCFRHRAGGWRARLARLVRVPAMLDRARVASDQLQEDERERALPLIARCQRLARALPPGGDAAQTQAFARSGTRRGAAATNDIATTTVPVLMYHRVAREGAKALAQWRLHPDRLEEQLCHLREQGYHGITSVELLGMLQSGRPLPGRPVLLTFDDGYRDFATTAWPLLERYGFPAEVFIVTDRVGGAADWDAHLGAAAPLMDWNEIQALRARGVRFGSHLATHRRAPHLSMHELVEEAARSRYTLEHRLGEPVRSVAMPFGDYDRRLLAALEWTGYECGYTVEEGRATVGMAPLTLPRIEVMGGDDMSTFARKLQAA